MKLFYEVVCYNNTRFPKKSKQLTTFDAAKKYFKREHDKFVSLWFEVDPYGDSSGIFCSESYIKITIEDIKNN